MTVMGKKLNKTLTVEKIHVPLLEWLWKRNQYQIYGLTEGEDSVDRRFEDEVAKCIWMW